MPYLSVRTLLKILNLTDQISIKNEIFSVGNMPGPPSLKRNLVLLDAMLEFAPEVRLHPSDENRPSSVEFFLDRTNLIFEYIDSGFLPGTFKVMVRSPSVNQLISQSVQLEFQDQTYFKQHSGSGNTTTRFKLVIQPQKKDETRKGEINKFKDNKTTDDVPCYCHINSDTGNPEVFDFQYLFFYPYNSQNVLGFGLHEGDWEHITVRARLPQKSILGIYLSAHDNEGGWAKVLNSVKPSLLPRLTYFLKDDGQPVVYSAKGSHASIEGPGEIDRSFPKPNDHTSNNGPRWNCRGNLLYVGTRNAPTKGQEWIRFTGRWGTVEGPWFQKGGWWSKLEQLNAPSP